MSRCARSTRFPVGLHIMCLLAMVKLRNGEVYVSSGWMSGSVNKNEATVRLILGRLVKAGLAKSMAGSRGGAVIAKPIEEISLLDIYKAVEDERIFGVHDANAECPIAQYVGGYIEKFFDDAESKFERDLAGVVLSDIVVDMYKEFTERGLTPPPYRNEPAAVSQERSKH
jgi:DNA-binding IscR family transcriptional regulator